MCWRWITGLLSELLAPALGAAHRARFALILVPLMGLFRMLLDSCPLLGGAGSGVPGGPASSRGPIVSGLQWAGI